jgi:hypothetical protein
VCHVPQRWHLEFRIVAMLPGDFTEAQIERLPVRTDAQAGEFLVGEVEPVVAFGAFSGALEDLIAAFCRRTQRLLVAIQKTIVR